MNTNHIFYAAAAVAADAAPARSKNDAAKSGIPENPDTQSPFIFTASIDDGADSRISMDHGVTRIALTGKTGDKIHRIYNQTGSTRCAFTAHSVPAAGKKSTFKAPANCTGSPPMQYMEVGKFSPRNGSGRFSAPCLFR